MLLEVNDNKGEHLRNACIEALAFISASMGWKQYYALLNRCFKELKVRPDRQKLFLRLICSILDKFHFSEVFVAMANEIMGVRKGFNVAYL